MHATDERRTCSLPRQRDETLALMCLRPRVEASEARGIDRHPAEVAAPLEMALVHSLDKPELRRPLATAMGCFLNEVELWDPALCKRLKSVLQELGAG